MWNEFFNSNVCHVCKTFDKPLKRCSSCKIMAYCSTEHQKSDWKLHKKLCQIIHEGPHLPQVIITSFQDLVNIQILKYEYWKKKLDRDLYNFEMQMWMFPRHCAVCYSQEANNSCEKCHNISYCSEDHKMYHGDQHKHHCNELKLSLEADIAFFQEINDFSLDVSPCDIPDNINDLPEHLKQLMCLYDRDYSIGDNLGYEEVLRQIRITDLIAPVATILYGLEVSGFLNDRMFPKDELHVHLVGADLTEMGFLWKLMSELPFHWIKNLKKLEYTIIGPDLGHNETTDKFTHQLCNSCKNKNSTTRITFHEQLYHNIERVLKKPDVVVALNSGLHEFSDDTEKDTWKESIPFLCKNPRVPLILTAYTEEEIVADIKLVKKTNTRVEELVNHHRNPFSNIKPLRNFASETDPIYYINGYVTVLMKHIP